LKVVLDTNTLVSALLFGGTASGLVPLWQSRRIQLVVSKDILEEYAYVLAYPKFQLEEAEVRDLLEQEVLPFAAPVRVGRHLSICRDPDDDKFLECALTARARFLVTGDSDLLDLQTRSKLEIISPAELLRRLEQTTKKPPRRKRRRPPKR
jgi:putative PIN family toxin of toxin-antitoxin system